MNVNEKILEKSIGINLYIIVLLLLLFIKYQLY